MAKCWNCGNELRENAAFCDQCSEAVLRCKKCGTLIDDSTRCCPKCQEPYSKQVLQMLKLPLEEDSEELPVQEEEAKKEKETRSVAPVNLMPLQICCFLLAVFVVIQFVQIWAIIIHRTCISHSYTERSCESAEVCVYCGQIKNPPLGHDWSESVICSVCGKPSSIATGDSILFGKFEQDKDFLNGPEPIKWKVLQMEDDRILLLSEYVLDYRALDTSAREDNYDWNIAQSDLYEWLNGEFLEHSFSEKEQTLIMGSNQGGVRVFLPAKDDCDSNIYTIDESSETKYARWKAGTLDPLGYWYADDYSSFSSHAYYDDGTDGISSEYMNRLRGVRPMLYLNYSYFENA